MLRIPNNKPITLIHHCVECVTSYFCSATKKNPPKDSAFRKTLIVFVLTTNICEKQKSLPITPSHTLNASQNYTSPVTLNITLCNVLDLHKNSFKRFYLINTFYFVVQVQNSINRYCS